MAYERDESRNRPYGRDRQFSRGDYGRDQSRAPGERSYRDDERGFFERAGDEIASWFGDEDRERGGRDHGPTDRGDRRPSPGFNAAGGMGDRYADRSSGRTQPWGGQRSQRGQSSEQDFDPHYRSWRERQIEALDRDYGEYRREHQSKFENDFGSWRQRRMSKRSMLNGVREGMEVVGNDDEHVGTVDRVVGDRIILTKSDPESGGVHHSLSCSDIDRVEDNRVVFECTAEESKTRWRDENRSRALFEREDQGEMGPRILDRSFEGTY